MEFLTINGRQYPLEEQDYEMSLLQWLREKLDLTGTKCGCNVGQCGSCNVIMDGKIRRSCVVKCGKAIGSSITTIEGLARDGKLHPVQESFLVCGVMQCGYCTPAQVLTVVALLEQNPNPSRADVDRAFKGTLCRCATYPRVLKAIERAGAILRGEPWKDEEKNDPNKIIGNSYTMPDAIEKITGKTKYCGDYYFENQVYGKLVFAEFPHAKLVDIDVEACLALPGVVYVHCFKTAPVPIVGSLENDMPIVACGKVRHMGEIVAMVYAETQEQADYAASQLKVTYEVLEPVTDPYRAAEAGAPIVHEEKPDNVAVRCTICKGDMAAALERAAAVVEGTYYSQRIEHNYIETECFVANPDGKGNLDLYVVSQSYYHERKAAAAYCGVPESRINVHQTPLGGSFGGKECHPVPALVAYAAFRIGRPVRLFLDRKDSNRFSTKRHPWFNEIALAMDAEGRILGYRNHMIADGGAYKSFSPRVLPQGCSYASGPYVVPNLDIFGRIMYTNNLSSGAMRGYGAPQTELAIEVAMDEMARKLEMDPIAIRRINGLKPGEESGTGAVLPEGHAYLKTLDAAERKYREEFLPMKERDPSIGIGVASGWRHITGGVGPAEECGAALSLLDNGHVYVNCGCAQMGNETLVGLAQIAAECLGLPFEEMEINYDLQTDNTPWGQGVMASRALLMWGTAVQAACDSFRKRLTEEGRRCISANAVFRDGKLYDERTGWVLADLRDLKKAYGKDELTVEEKIRLAKTYYPLEDGNRSRKIPVEEYRTHITSSYVTTIVALKADVEKKTARVLKMYAAYDVGTVINEEATRRQAEGGMIMAMGQGLQEEFVLENGQIKTDNMVKYKLPDMSDTPEIEVEFVDNYDPAGPLGAKGIGEIPLLSVQPAILNAYYDATGERVRQLPLLKHMGSRQGKTTEECI